VKFDKETAIVVIVCIVLITLCNMFLAPDKDAPEAEEVKKEETSSKKEDKKSADTKTDVKEAKTEVKDAAKDAKTEVKGAAKDAKAEVKDAAKDAKAEVKDAAKDAKAEVKDAKTEVKSAEKQPVMKPAAPAPKDITIENDLAVFHFNEKGVLHEIVVKNLHKTKSDDPILFKEFSGNEPFSCDIDGWDFVSAKVVKNSDTKLTVEQNYTKGNDKVTVKKVFFVEKDYPSLKCKFSFSGTVKELPKVTIWSGTIAPLKQFSNDELRDVHQAEYMLAADGDVETADPNVKKQEKYLGKKTSDPVKWVAVSNKYLLSQLYADKPFNGGCVLINHKDNDYAEPGIAGIYENVPVDTEYDLSLYAGAKEIAQMSKLPEDAQEAIHLAYWSWFEFLCRPMLALLNWLKSFSGSYGLAIILLTILVKLVLWPLIHKGNKSMRKMTKIQPMLKDLKEKYKDNPQLFNQKMMELYRQEKVNPLGGCLPMLLQFPVFIALYSTLEAAVELRNVPFLWAKDLSQPDAIGPEIWGFSLHPLILISTGLMVLQMKLTPQAGDPLQRKLMMFMPLIMLIFFYNFPSGLALYWTVNNILSILQMKYSQYAAKKEEEREASSAAKAA